MRSVGSKGSRAERFECLLGPHGRICGWPGKLQVISRSLTTLPWEPQPIAPSRHTRDRSTGCTDPSSRGRLRANGWCGNSQPVVAYFTFIQNNIQQLAGGIANQVMREAEQRHLQIMNEALQGLRNEWTSRLAQKDQECEQRVQDAESQALAAISVAKDRSDELEARFQKTKQRMTPREVSFRQRQTNCVTWNSKRKGNVGLCTHIVGSLSITINPLIGIYSIPMIFGFPWHGMDDCKPYTLFWP